MPAALCIFTHLGEFKHPVDIGFYIRSRTKKKKKNTKKKNIRKQGCETGTRATGTTEGAAEAICSELETESEPPKVDLS